MKSNKGGGDDDKSVKGGDMSSKKKLTVKDLLNATSKDLQGTVIYLSLLIIGGNTHPHFVLQNPVNPIQQVTTSYNRKST